MTTIKKLLPVNVQRWERIISDEEDVLDKCKQNEEKHRAGIEEDKKKIEELKAEKQEKKKIADQMEKDMNKARHDVATLAKDIYNINYQVSSIDTKIETKKNERHNILIQSKVGIDTCIIEIYIANWYLSVTYDFNVRWTTFTFRWLMEI